VVKRLANLLVLTAGFFVAYPFNFIIHGFFLSLYLRQDNAIEWELKLLKLKLIVLLTVHHSVSV
jgi:hypothetical protein